MGHFHIVDTDDSAIGMQNVVCNLFAAVNSHRAVFGRYCLFANSADMIEIVGVEILVAIVFSPQGCYMQGESIFQLLIDLLADATKHRCDGVLRTEEQRGSLETSGEACHSVGLPCLLLVEIRGEEMS